MFDFGQTWDDNLNRRSNFRRTFDFETVLILKHNFKLGDYAMQTDVFMTALKGQIDAGFEFLQALCVNAATIVANADADLLALMAFDGDLYFSVFHTVAEPMNK